MSQPTCAALKVKNSGNQGGCRLSNIISNWNHFKLDHLNRIHRKIKDHLESLVSLDSIHVTSNLFAAVFETVSSWERKKGGRGREGQREERKEGRERREARKGETCARCTRPMQWTTA